MYICKNDRCKKVLFRRIFFHENIFFFYILGFVMETIDRFVWFLSLEILKKNGTCSTRPSCAHRKSQSTRSVYGISIFFPYNAQNVWLHMFKNLRRDSSNMWRYSSKWDSTRREKVEFSILSFIDTIENRRKYSWTRTNLHEWTNVGHIMWIAISDPQIHSTCFLYKYKL